ncbi:MAG TPA: glycosyltransferase family A protein [Candidatus Sulfotelmatobacter sp.]|nr:glycosyltransferase family A protein [Candidatus Sulfotelmatobacter sp.]
MINLTLYLLIASIPVELSMWLRPFWRLRKLVSYFIIAASLILSLLLLKESFTLLSVIVPIITCYRCFNLLRLIKGRTSSDYLYGVSLKSSLTLNAALLLSIGIYFLNLKLNIDDGHWLAMAITLESLLLLVLLFSTLRHIKTTNFVTPKLSYESRHLPTISVLIPARNETVDLEQCLTTLVASDYPKLEIIVLDDCSQQKQTPQIIKSYAHSGVRFIAGKEPPEYWAAKNWAYQQLLMESSGDYLLFCGVDTRFSPETISLALKALLERKKTMVSFMPLNSPPSTNKSLSLVFQPSRYFWELAIPRKLLKRPPVLSTFWLIQRTMIEKAGGFKSVMKSGSPESYFAREAIKFNDSYSFLRSSPALGLFSIKPFDDQLNTAIRTRYPQTHRRPEIVFLLSLLEVSLLVLPIYLLDIAIRESLVVLIVVSALNLLVLVSLFIDYVSLTYGKFYLRSILLMPVAIAIDVGLMNYSMYKYEFSEVIWKGRNVCLPLMRIPS